jgi:hypothetical protein
MNPNPAFGRHQLFTATRVDDGNLLAPAHRQFRGRSLCLPDDVGSSQCGAYRELDGSSADKVPMVAVPHVAERGGLITEGARGEGGRPITPTSRHCHVNQLEPPFFLPVPRVRGKAVGTPSVSRSRAARHRRLHHITTPLRDNAGQLHPRPRNR